MRALVINVQNPIVIIVIISVVAGAVAIEILPFVGIVREGVISIIPTVAIRVGTSVPIDWVTGVGVWTLIFGIVDAVVIRIWASVPIDWVTGSSSRALIIHIVDPIAIHVRTSIRLIGDTITICIVSSVVGAFIQVIGDTVAIVIQLVFGASIRIHGISGRSVWTLVVRIVDAITVTVVLC